MRFLSKYLLATVLAPASVASAQSGLLVPVSQERGVEAYIRGGQGQVESASDEASGFGTYWAAFDLDGSTIADGGNSFARVSQASEIREAGIHAELFGWTLADGLCGPNESVDTLARSTTAVTFELTRPAGYHLDLTYGSFDGTPGRFAYELRRVPGPIVFGESREALAKGLVNLSGVLPPGQYRYEVSATVRVDTVGMDQEPAYVTTSSELDFFELATPYCQATSNSVDPDGARMAFLGTTSIQANDFTLRTTHVIPFGSGIYFYGPDQLQLPFGDGFRCVGGVTQRIQSPVTADASGFAQRTLDLSAPPYDGSGNGTIAPLTTWNFQYWYRDPSGPGGTGFNTSDGLAVNFFD